MVLQFLGNGLINGSLIALTALGFSLIYNTTRVFHIAYAGIYIWSGYLLFFFSSLLGLPLIVAFLLSLIAAAGLSAACEVLLYSPMMRRGRSHDALMIVSVALLIILVSLAELFFGNAARYTDYGFDGALRLNEIFFPGYRMISLMVCSSLIMIFFLYLKYSPTGIKVRALRDNELLSRISGIDTRRLRVWLFLLSGAMVSVAAGLNTLDIGVNPHLGIPMFINAFVALVIGGIGRFDGPVTGGFLLGILQSMTEYFSDSRWVMMVTFIVLFLFLLVRPQGLVPERSRNY
jgi:branched-chain amino acid transport system permease protein